VPHAGDQARQAQGVARTGVGLHIPPAQVTVEVLAAGLAALLPDLSPYRAQAATLQAEFAALGGVPAAADILETFVAAANVTDARR
jgi:UDP:flavonoid glycosyltransferase YjiC (YdhE family)